MTAIDTNGLDLLAELKKTLDKKSIEVRKAYETLKFFSFTTLLRLIIYFIFVVCFGKSCGKCNGEATQIKSSRVI